MADMMDKTISAILTAFVAVILIASAFIPTAIQQINNLSQYGTQVAQYTALISTVIVVVIVGVIIGVVKSYTKDGGLGGSDEER